MIDALVGFLNQNGKMDQSLVDEACKIAKKVNTSSDKGELYKLTELVVQWVICNSLPKKLGEVDYNR